MVDRIFEVTVSTAARIATFGSAMPIMCARSIAFCTISTLSSSSRFDVDRRVRDQQRARIGRHVGDEHVADPPRGAQTVFLGDHLAHQLVGMQAALHDSIDVAAMRELYRAGRRRVAMRLIDDLDAGQVELELLGQRANPLLRADQQRDHQPQIARRQARPAATRRRMGAQRQWESATGRWRPTAGVDSAVACPRSSLPAA